METMKEKWICPDAQVQVFTPQEFVAVCEDQITGHTLVALCADGDHKIEFTNYNPGGNEGDANVDAWYSGDSNGHMFKRTDGTWAYAGRISWGHGESDPKPPTQGEWMNITSSDRLQGKTPGMPHSSRGVTYCDCVFYGESPAQHHHLTIKDIITSGNIS